jgi:hypothetical protein
MLLLLLLNAEERSERVDDDEIYVGNTYTSAGRAALSTHMIITRKDRRNNNKRASCELLFCFSES